MYQIILLAIISIIISGCGSSSSTNENSNNINTNKVGYFIDSAVSGVEYECGSLSGITGKNGEFNYNNSCIVIFKLGGILLGKINGEDINNDNNVLPADLIGVQRDNTSNEKVIKLIQFLQTIDNDDNPNNNISIEEKTRKAFKECVLDFSKDETHTDEIQEVITLINKQLVSKESALKHYEEVLESRFDIVIQKNDPIIKEVIITDEEEKSDDKVVEIIPEIIPIIKPIEEIIREVVVINDLSPDEKVVEELPKEELPIEKEEIVLDEVNPIKEELVINDLSPDEKVVEELPKEELPIEKEEIVLDEVDPIKEELVINDLSPNEKVVEELPKEEELPIEEEVTPIEENVIQKVVSIDIESSNIEEENETTGFSYENQRDVKIFISSKESLSNKQVLLYEDVEIVSTPVGDLETYKNKIISTVFNINGELNLTYTLGNHITSIWLVIPFYNINMEVPIQNNHVYLTLNEEEI